jgi:hypothetical protein
MAVTMKNVVFWDTKTEFVPHRGHISPLQSPAHLCYVRFKVFTVKNAVFWDVSKTLERTDVSEERIVCIIRVKRINLLGTTLAVTSNRRTLLVFLRSVRRLLVTASVVPSSPILVTLMKEALGSSETSVLTRATRRNIPEDTTLHSHRRENLKSHFSLLSNARVSPLLMCWRHQME